MPYYIDGDVKLSQSLAILRYIGRKHKLDGSTEEEKIRISLLEQQVTDMNFQIIRISYDPNCDKLKEDYVKNLPDSLKLVSKFLGDHPFAAGTNISYVDFLLYEYLTKISVLVSDVFGQFPNLKKFLERIESLPRVSTYMKFEKPSLFNGSMANWNATH